MIKQPRAQPDLNERLKAKYVQLRDPVPENIQDVDFMLIFRMFENVNEMTGDDGSDEKQRSAERRYLRDMAQRMKGEKGRELCRKWNETRAEDRPRNFPMLHKAMHDTTSGNFGDKMVDVHWGDPVVRLCVTRITSFFHLNVLISSRIHRVQQHPWAHFLIWLLTESPNAKKFKEGTSTIIFEQEQVHTELFYLHLDSDVHTRSKFVALRYKHSKNDPTAKRHPFYIYGLPVKIRDPETGKMQIEDVDYKEELERLKQAVTRVELHPDQGCLYIALSDLPRQKRTMTMDDVAMGGGEGDSDSMDDDISKADSSNKRDKWAMSSSSSDSEDVVVNHQLSANQPKSKDNDDDSDSSSDSEDSDAQQQNSVEESEDSSSDSDSGQESKEEEDLPSKYGLLTKYIQIRDYAPERKNSEQELQLIFQMLKNAMLLKRRRDFLKDGDFESEQDKINISVWSTEITYLMKLADYAIDRDCKKDFLDFDALGDTHTTSKYLEDAWNAVRRGETCVEHIVSIPMGRYEEKVSNAPIMSFFHLNVLISMSDGSVQRNPWADLLVWLLTTDPFAEKFKSKTFKIDFYNENVDTELFRLHLERGGRGDQPTAILTYKNRGHDPPHEFYIYGKSVERANKRSGLLEMVDICYSSEVERLKKVMKTGVDTNHDMDDLDAKPWGPLEGIGKYEIEWRHSLKRKPYISLIRLRHIVTRNILTEFPFYVLGKERQNPSTHAKAHLNPIDEVKRLDDAIASINAEGQLSISDPQWYGVGRYAGLEADEDEDDEMEIGTASFYRANGNYDVEWRQFRDPHKMKSYIALILEADYADENEIQREYPFYVMGKERLNPETDAKEHVNPSDEIQRLRDAIDSIYADQVSVREPQWESSSELGASRELGASSGTSGLGGPGGDVSDNDDDDDDDLQITGVSSIHDPVASYDFTEPGAENESHITKDTSMYDPEAPLDHD